MNVYKCDMCGGTIEFEPGAVHGVCDSCGRKVAIDPVAAQKYLSVYNSALGYMKKGKAEDWQSALRLFETIPFYADGSAKAEECRKKLAEIENEKLQKAEKKENAAAEKAEKKQEFSRKKAEVAAKTKRTVKRIFYNFLMIIFLIVAFAALLYGIWTIVLLSDDTVGYILSAVLFVVSVIFFILAVKCKKADKKLKQN